MTLVTRQLLVSRNKKKIAAAKERAAIEGETLANLHAFEDLTDCKVSTVGTHWLPII